MIVQPSKISAMTWMLKILSEYSKESKQKESEHLKMSMMKDMLSIRFYILTKMTMNYKMKQE